MVGVDPGGHHTCPRERGRSEIRPPRGAGQVKTEQGERGVPGERSDTPPAAACGGPGSRRRPGADCLGAFGGSGSRHRVLSGSSLQNRERTRFCAFSPRRVERCSGCLRASPAQNVTPATGPGRIRARMGTTDASGLFNLLFDSENKNLPYCFLLIINMTHVCCIVFRYHRETPLVPAGLPLRHQCQGGSWTRKPPPPATDPGRLVGQDGGRATVGAGIPTSASCRRQLNALFIHGCGRRSC